MSTVAVVTDSCASIPEPMIQALDIRWVPYYIHRGKEVLRDLVTAQRDSSINGYRPRRSCPRPPAPDRATTSRYTKRSPAPKGYGRSSVST